MKSSQPASDVKESGVRQLAGAAAVSTLDEVDIDALTTAVRGSVLPARVVYDATTANDDGKKAEGVRKVILEKLKEGNAVVAAPVWTRHHWACAVFSRPRGATRKSSEETKDKRAGEAHNVAAQLEAVVFDSAAHPATARDWRQMLAKLGVAAESCKIVQHWRQPRGSAECGVNAALLAFLAAEYPQAVLAIENSLEVVSLKSLREELLGAGWPPLSLSIIGRHRMPIVCTGPARPSEKTQQHTPTILKRAQGPPAITGAGRDSNLQRRSNASRVLASSEPIEINSDDSSDTEPPETVLVESVAYGDLKEFKKFATDKEWREYIGIFDAFAADKDAPKDKTMVLVPLWRLPKGRLRSKLARWKHRADASENKELEVINEAATDGTLVETRIVDTFIEAMNAAIAQESRSFVLGSIPFLAGARAHGSRPELPGEKERLATVFVRRAHYVAICYNAVEQTIYFGDSLDPRAQGGKLSELDQWAVDAFRAWLRDAGYKIRSIKRMIVRPQRTNECAFEACNAVLGFIAAKNPAQVDLFSRNLLRRSDDKSSMERRQAPQNLAELRRRTTERIVNKICVSKQQELQHRGEFGFARKEHNEKTEAEAVESSKDKERSSGVQKPLRAEVAEAKDDSTHRRGPRRRTTAPSAQPQAGVDEQTAKAHTQCQSCKRPAVGGGWCAWHEPRISGVPYRPQCTAKTANMKRCRELALALLNSSADSLIFSSSFCFYHMTPRERERLAAMLQEKEKEKEPVKEAPGTTDVSTAGRSISHLTLRNILRARNYGSIVHLEVAGQPEAPTKAAWLVKVVSPRSALGTIHEVEPLARWCSRCAEWHLADSDVRWQVPAVEARYFNVRSASPEEVSALKQAETQDCCDDDEADSESDTDDEGPTEGERPETFAEDDIRQPLLRSYDSDAAAGPLVRVAKSWFLHGPGRPSHVHRASWNALSEQTRREHRRWLVRLKNAPPELLNAPLAVGVVEIATRLAHERRWANSTLASKLAAAATALLQLPLYSSSCRGYDIRQDPFYASAKASAIKCGRVGARIAPPLSATQVQQLAKSLPPDAWLLLQVAWWAAARVGDARQVNPVDIEFTPSSKSEDALKMVVGFKKGKGAHFWGPYHIHSVVPRDMARAIEEAVRARKKAGATTLVDTTAQRTLSRAIQDVCGAQYTLRSVRRGAIVEAAESGVTDEDLMLLSGHARKDTLMRYLGWGKLSAEAGAAAERRFAAASKRLSGGNYDGPNWHPQAMGQYSGFTSAKETAGRRNRPPPALFPRCAPSRAELGIDTKRDEEDRASWPLHVKDVATLRDMLTIVDEAHEFDEALHREAVKATSWLAGVTNLGVHPNTTLARGQVPISSFTSEQVKRMLKGRKLVPLGDRPIRCGVRGFAIAQEAKKRWRPILEPLYNALLARDELPILKYPSRYERRRLISRARFFVQFDFAAFFDQLELQASVEEFHVIRTKEPVEWEGVTTDLFCLTRAPMGAVWAPYCAQYITWILCQEISAGKTGAQVCTMIDNVGITAQTGPEFVKAVRTFLQSCKKHGVTLNDEAQETLSALSDDELCERFRMAPGRSETFLGEEYTAGSQGDAKVSNTKRNVQKLTEAWERLRRATEESDIRVTKRHVAAIIGLMNWMAHTVDLPIRKFVGPLRTMATLTQTHGSWDDRIPNESLLRLLSGMAEPIARLAENVPVDVGSTPPPAATEEYDTILIVDAAATGWAAICVRRSGTLCIRQGWEAHMRFSAHAEPLAATLAVRWAKSRFKSDVGRIAVVTDHAALALKQRSHETHNGGFSRNWYLNQFYNELYDEANTDRNDVFYVEGPNNPADSPSRSTAIGDSHVYVERVSQDFRMPDLRLLFHPHRTSRPRPWWCV